MYFYFLDFHFLEIHYILSNFPLLRFFSNFIFYPNFEKMFVCILTRLLLIHIRARV